MHRLFHCVVASFGLAATAAAQSPELVAPTDPLPPAQQREKFRLPPGFEIQLVASEPTIGQPMNLNFDAAGRLWVTHSVEYPYPVAGEGVQPRDPRFGTPADHAPRDRVTVFEGIGADGKPAKSWDFATGLNIPIGVLPVPDGALVYSIPSIRRCTDRDGDGRADGCEVLFGGFGNVDTHGMVSSLTRWLDGWVYGCHGFRNDSKVVDKSGHVTTMNSGNTYRFRLDGSRFEQWTWGQVNPYGLTFDPWGNAFTADCHSKPLTMLLRGAYYSSFGKPHDGLGFGPDVIDHGHGSTGICGPAYYAADRFPPEYRDNVYLCNPVTGRVHRDKLKWTGSSPHVDTQPDFVTCEDPWFRPVDCQVGPDGALYIADFYNAVIGHYEVPLEHPKRDRTHGRVWRVVYTESRGVAPPRSDLTALDAAGLVAKLADANLVVRTLATNELVDRVGQGAVPVLEEALRGETTPEQRAHGLWVLQRLDALNDARVEKFAADPSPLVRTHLVKALAERETWDAPQSDCVKSALFDGSPFVQRAAAEALSRHPHVENLRPLLDCLAKTPVGDVQLRHMLRIALRDQLRDVTIATTVVDETWSDEDARVLAGVALAVPTPAAAAFLAKRLRTGDVTDDALRHVARYGTGETVDATALTLRSRIDLPVTRQVEQLLAIHEGLNQRGMPAGGEVKLWATDIATKLLDAESQSRLLWSNAPLPGGNADDPWTVQQRPSADGQSAAYFSSLPTGEQKTGRYRSAAFALPAKLSFFVAGHRGFPDAKPHAKNVVRLRDADSGAVLVEAFPPRHDVARKVEWDLKDHAGRRGFVEVVDGDTAGAYAWLAVGRFSLDALNPPAVAAAPLVELVARYRLDELRPRLQTVLQDETADTAKRLVAAESLLRLVPDARLSALVSVAGDAATSAALRERVFGVVAARDEEKTRAVFADVMQAVPASRQQVLAETLATDRAGARLLLALVRAGRASARLLIRPTVRQKVAAHGEFDEALAELTAKLPSEDERLTNLIRERLRDFAPQSADVVAGKVVFTKNCAACHRIGEEGGLVGPQLDGVGVRGLERILEDVLDPHRNVDAAFRSETLALDSGQVRTGLFRRQEGATLVFADEQGKEFSVRAEEVVERAKSLLSLMPANVAERLPKRELDDLLAYLLSQRVPPAQ